MSLGVHFALGKKDLERIKALEEPDALGEFISDLEERYLDDGDWAYETDKAWDAIHRCLTDGRLLYEEGPFPLAFAFLGGRRLKTHEDCTACLVEPEQVLEVSKALASVTHDWFKQRYATLKETDYDGPIGEEDLAYSWENLIGLRDFIARAAKTKRALVFSVDA